MTGSWQFNDTPGGTVTPNTWFHIGVTWPGPGNLFKLYIDGAFFQNSTESKFIAVYNRLHSIGRKK